MRKLKMRIIRETDKAALLESQGCRRIVTKGSLLYKIAKGTKDQEGKK